jgi:hypothetical protein
MIFFPQKWAPIKIAIATVVAITPVAELRFSAKEELEIFSKPTSAIGIKLSAFN